MPTEMTPSPYTSSIAGTTSPGASFTVELALDDYCEAIHSLPLLDGARDHVLDGRGDGLKELVEELLVAADRHRHIVHSRLVRRREALRVELLQ
jgi:hypothetical protein